MEEINIKNDNVTGLLSEGTRFEGNLSFEGCVRIGGEFIGEIFTKDTLIISPKAKVRAEIEARKVIISGFFNGNIHATEGVVMRPPAVFKGSVSSPNLDISEGVIFEGASYMSPSEDLKKEQANAAY